ncbi:MAG: glycosyl hydrolase 115 family protein, partial [Phycisphaerales bacterium]
GKDLSDVPQVWALYKEVQDYYDKGMRVPDDVTLLLCDDNWGNVRILPNPDSKPRKGGYGMYYHFDFYGGPRSYLWLNTNPIPKIWEQMHLTYRHGVDRIWIVNVGDLKPMEFPISFFLNYALDPDNWSAERLPEYTRLWAEQQFGPEHAGVIAELLDGYTKFNGRRKPELLAPDTYSLVNYREAETVVADYNKLAEKAKQIEKALPTQYQDAYYQLVLHPVLACANLNELYVTAGKNQLYASQGRAAANDLAKKVEELFKKDSEINRRYNKLANGKWNHMMDTTHIGYTSWNEPKKNIIPEVKKVELSAAAEMGVAIEGTTKWWPESKEEAVLLEFDKFNKQSYYIEVFNRGQANFDYTAKSSKSWLLVTPEKGQVEKEKRLDVSVDWQQVPTGKQSASIAITGPNKNKVTVQAVINNPETPQCDKVKGFVESNGYVSIEAEHYTKAIGAGPVEWLTIPNAGRTLSGVTPVPVTVKNQSPQADSPRLEYAVYLFNSGEVKVSAYLSPVQNFNKTQGLRYAISFDDEQPQIINIHEKGTIPDWNYPMWWNQMVSDSIKIASTTHRIDKQGEHVLKFWVVDAGIVLQKLVVDAGGLKPSYLGPPESYRGGKNSCSNIVSSKSCCSER